MTDACKPLSDHLAEKRANGLVDIKFYVHNHSEASVALVCAEAVALFDAVKDGAAEDFEFSDKRPMAAAA
jgi:hypothetical protein